MTSGGVEPLIPWFFNLAAALLSVIDPSPDGFSTAAPSITSASGLAVVRLPELFILSDDFFRSAICHSSLKRLAKFYIIDFHLVGPI